VHGTARSAAPDAANKSRGFTVAWDHCPELMDLSEELLTDGRDNGPSLLLTFADCVAWHGTTEHASYFCWMRPHFHWGCVLCRLDDNCSDNYLVVYLFSLLF
jgi:hypothetical protein